MTLSETIVETIGNIFSRDDTISRLKLCAKLRISHEGWLKIELLNALSDEGQLTLFPEKGNVDIVVYKGNSKESCLVELKTFPTNYGGSGKPITNFIKSVIKDIDKLKAKHETAETGMVVWVAYPIPQDNSIWNDSHYSKVYEQAGEPISSKMIKLGNNCHAHLYIHQAFSNASYSARIAGQ